MAKSKDETIQELTEVCNFYHEWVEAYRLYIGADYDYDRFIECVDKYREIERGFDEAPSNPLFPARLAMAGETLEAVLSKSAHAHGVDFYWSGSLWEIELENSAVIVGAPTFPEAVAALLARSDG